MTAGFLETTAIIGLAWAVQWEAMESAAAQSERQPESPPESPPGIAVFLPKTIDFTVDFLRSGLPRDAYARARISRSGRRYASVHVEAWQDNRDRLYAQATGHFLMPARQ